MVSKTFNFSHMLLHLLGDLFIPLEKYLPHLFLPCVLLCTQDDLKKHGDGGSVIAIRNIQLGSNTN